LYCFQNSIWKRLWKIIIIKKKRNTLPSPRPGPKAEAQQFSPSPSARPNRPSSLRARFPLLRPSQSLPHRPHTSALLLPSSRDGAESDSGANQNPDSPGIWHVEIKPSLIKLLVMPRASFSTRAAKKPSPSGLPHPVLDLADSLPIFPRGHTTPGSLRPK